MRKINKLKRMGQSLHDNNLENLQKMFNQEENPKLLNEIMSKIAETQIIPEEKIKETNYVSIEEDIYHQMGLIKLDDLESIPLERIQQKLEKKWVK